MAQTKTPEFSDEEADYWDEFFTKNPPKVDPHKKGGFFTQQRELLSALKPATADYILRRSMATKKPPAQIIEEAIQREMTVNGV